MNDGTKRDWIRVLESLRFDIVRRDPMQAHKEYDSRSTAEVWLDESGQIRMTITRQSGNTQREERVSRAGRTYRVFVEQQGMTIINYRLRASDDLGEVLREMEKEITK